MRFHSTALAGTRLPLAPARTTPARLTVILLAIVVVAALLGLAAGSNGWSLDWSADEVLIRSIRAPRTLGALLAGGLLGLSGAIAQGVFRNPLADPYLLGSSSGATLALVVVLAAGSLSGTIVGFAPVGWLAKAGLVGAAFAGALGGVVLTVILGRGAARPTVLVLSGVVVGILLGAVANLVLLASPEAMRGAQVFMLGTTGFLGWRSDAYLAVTLTVSVPLALRYGRVLDALVLGEPTALSLGVPVPRARMILVALLALATGTAVAETGLVAFVGLASPHVVRRSVLVTHGPLLALSALTGGTLLLVADVAARSLTVPSELPVGLLTAIVGGGYLLMLLHRRSGDGL